MIIADKFMSDNGLVIIRDKLNNILVSNQCVV